jgi:hypothetical protein
MSRSVDLFIAASGPVADLASTIGRLTGAEPSPGREPDTWLLTVGEVRAELHAHPYLDDGALLLRRYPFALSCRLSGAGRPADSAEVVMLRSVSDALRGEGVPSVVVHDLQYRDAPPAGDNSGGPTPAADADTIVEE